VTSAPPVVRDQPLPPDGPPGVWSIAWPTMTLFGLHALVGIVDFVFVSSLGTGAVASVGVAMQIHFLAFAVMNAVMAGTTAVVAREWGRGDREEAGRAVRCSVALAAALGALLMVAIPFARPIVGLLGVSADVQQLGGDCLRVLLLSNVPFAVGATLGVALRAAGDARTPLAVGILTNLVNVVGDYALVFGRLGAPELGAVGSSWATALAFLTGVLAAGWLWLGGYLVLPVGRWRGSVTRLLSLRMLRVGLPSALEMGAFNVGLLLFMGIVADFGTEPVSAYLIGVRILSFCFIPGLGFSMAAGTVVGQHLGAEQPEQAARAGWRGLLAAMVVMGSVGLGIVLLARPLASLFGAVGEQTIDLTVTFIHILGAAQPLMAVEFVLGGGLRGAGDTRSPLVAMVAGLFVARLATAVWIAAPLFGTVTAVWSCLLADYTLKAGILVWRFASGRWKEVAV
jgi:putative MATE family efflux protein